MSETVGPQGPEIVDPHHVQTLFVDWIVTRGTLAGVMNITLGTLDHSMRKLEAELPRVVVATRLRFSHEFALLLHRAIGEVLGLPPQTPGNEPPPKPPTNLIN